MEELRERISEIIFDSQDRKNVDKSRDTADRIIDLITKTDPVAAVLLHGDRRWKKAALL